MLHVTNLTPGSECQPCLQGPQNIGGIARVMNNFGITDLRIVTPEAPALAPPYDAQDENDRPDYPAGGCLFRVSGCTDWLHGPWLSSVLVQGFGVLTAK